jgi:hypothetical protein
MKSMGRYPACQAAPFLAAPWIWPVYNGYYMGTGRFGTWALGVLVCELMVDLAVLVWVVLHRRRMAVNSLA